MTYEGTEKLLEVWFTPNSTESDLRRIPSNALRVILNQVKCEIVSMRSNDLMDAYVLSESSMFISRDRLILKTCGTTTLLSALASIVDVALESGFSEIAALFYSRKNFLNPHLQLYPHNSFAKEAEVMDTFIKNASMYCLGKLNGDHWYLYMKEGNVSRKEDQTLEILMAELDDTAMKCFFKSENDNAEKITEASGIRGLFSNATIDAKAFDPCGYSMNALLGDDQYATIHVTPEKQCSYVSFETNLSLPSFHQLIENVLQVFKPRRFCMTLFSAYDSPPKNAVVATGLQEGFNCYTETNRTNNFFKFYELLFATFVSSNS